MVYNIPLWQELIIYAYVFIAVTAFALLCKLRIFRINLMRLRTKVILSVFAPVLLALLLVLAPVLILLSILFLQKIKSSGKRFNITIRRL